VASGRDGTDRGKTPDSGAVGRPIYTAGKPASINSHRDKRSTMANARALLVHPEEGSDRIETALDAAVSV